MESIASLFPQGVIAVTAAESMWTGALHPEEEACVARAVPKRRREFTAGRLCAREALARLGLEGFPLLAGPDRAPQWPPGVVGSISHCDGHCSVAVARSDRFAGLGLDVELGEPLESDLVPRICSPAERARLSALPPPPAGGDWPKLLFSAKESTYKCYYPLGQTVLEFHDVDVAIDAGAGAFTATLANADVPPAGQARAFHGRFAWDGAYVFTAVALPAAASRAQPRSAAATTRR